MKKIKILLVMYILVCFGILLCFYLAKTPLTIILIIVSTLVIIFFSLFGDFIFTKSNKKKITSPEVEKMFSEILPALKEETFLEKLPPSNKIDEDIIHKCKNYIYCKFKGKYSVEIRKEAISIFFEKDKTFIYEFVKTLRLMKDEYEKTHLMKNKRKGYPDSVQGINEYIENVFLFEEWVIEYLGQHLNFSSKKDIKLYRKCLEDNLINYFSKEMVGLAIEERFKHVEKIKFDFEFTKSILNKNNHY